MKQITNEEFELAFKNAANVRIMKSASRKYQKVLGEDVLACQIHGLWTALRKYDATRGMRFTTYLFECVSRKCYAEASKLTNKKKREIIMPPDKLPDTTAYFETTFVSDMLMSLSEKDAKLLTDRYLSGKTLIEIGTEYGVTLQAIQQRLGTLSKKMRRILTR